MGKSIGETANLTKAAQEDQSKLITNNWYDIKSNIREFERKKDDTLYKHDRHRESYD